MTRTISLYLHGVSVAEYSMPQFLQAGFIDSQVVNVTLPDMQQMWLASSRPAKKQATAEWGIYQFRHYLSENQ